VFINAFHCYNVLKLTGLALKRFVVVENKQNAQMFHFKLQSFVGRGAKILFVPGRKVVGTLTTPLPVVQFY